MKKLIPSIVAVAPLAVLVLVAFSAEEVVAPAQPKTAVTNEPTVVDSQRFQADYLHNIGTFQGDVRVLDSRIVMRADKMTVWFGNSTNIVSGLTNTVRSAQRIIAEGSVVITTPDEKISHSDHAVYTAADGTVVLTGNPRVQSPDGTVTGKKITFRRNESKMDVESDATDTNRTRLIIYPDDQPTKDAPK